MIRGAGPLGDACALFVQPFAPHDSENVQGYLTSFQQWAGKPDCTEIVGVLLHGANDSTLQTLFHLKKANRRGESGVRQLQGNLGIRLEGS